MNFAAHDADAWKQYLAPSSTSNASTPTTNTKSSANKQDPQKKYNFRHYLNRALENCKGGELLSTDQFTQTIDTFAFIENYLPKRICSPFVAYKILDCILPQGKQRLILAYLENEIPKSTKHKHECSWNYMLAELTSS